MSSSPTTTAAERAEAASIRVGQGSSGTFDLSKLPKQVSIDEDARQKYVLVEVKRGGSEPSIYFVRGDRLASYHKDAARPLTRELADLSIKYEIVGGGRIDHSTNDAKIKIYGFSYGFPWKEGVSLHYITADILKTEYPGYSVEFSDEGY